MAKKTTNKKSKTKKTIDVSNVDAIMEDMKNLALEKPVEEKVEIEEKTKDENVVEDKENIETQLPQNEIEETTMVEQNVEEKNEEDLSFVEKISNGELVVKEDDTKALEKPVEEKVEIEEKPKNIENKPKRKSYSEMFGNTWCGYGYTD